MLFFYKKKKVFLYIIYIFVMKIREYLFRKAMNFYILSYTDLIDLKII